MQIRSSNIKNKLIQACVTTSTVECYIHHSMINHILTEHRKTEALRKIGSILTTLDTINNLSITLTGDLENNAIYANLEGKRKRKKQTLSLNLMTYQGLTGLKLSI